MASVESVLQAATVLSDISKVQVHDLLPHRNALENAFINLQKLLGTGISINRNNNGMTGASATVSAAGSNDSESNIGEVSGTSAL